MFFFFPKNPWAGRCLLSLWSCLLLCSSPHDPALHHCTAGRLLPAFTPPDSSPLFAWGSSSVSLLSAPQPSVLGSHHWWAPETSWVLSFQRVLEWLKPLWWPVPLDIRRFPVVLCSRPYLLLSDQVAAADTRHPANPNPWSQLACHSSPGRAPCLPAALPCEGWFPSSLWGNLSPPFPGATASEGSGTSFQRAPCLLQGSWVSPMVTTRQVKQELFRCRNPWASYLHTPGSLLQLLPMVAQILTRCRWGCHRCSSSSYL